ncbi:MAG: uL15 family ribosomal protein [Firmicutes bacterium]|nr:uL15 family ribosomal protein [Bacillota bacterium]
MYIELLWILLKNRAIYAAKDAYRMAVSVMKNLKKNVSNARGRNGFVKAIALVGCLAIIFGFAFTFTLVDIQGNGANDNTASAAIDPSIYNQPLDASFDALAHGSTYTFTDKTKVDQYRAGSIASDTTTITVDRRQPHGSQLNPYVINSISGGSGSWNAFAAAMANSATYNYGVGKYFVLTNDLNWKPGSSQIAYTKIGTFGGNFYGLGHSLINIVLDGNNNSNVSLFDIIMDGEFADVIVNSYTFNNVLFGACFAINAYGTSFMNCHAQGSINRVTASNTQFHAGGMFFSPYTPSGKPIKDVLLYRCSIKWTANGKVTSSPTGGSLCGGIIGSSVYPYKIYDCYATCDVTYENNYSDTYINPICTTAISGANNVKRVVENVVSIMVHRGANTWDESASIMSGWIDTTAGSAKSNNEFYYTNVYSDYKAINSSGTAHIGNPSVFYSAQQNVIINQGTKINLNNVQYVNSYGSYTLNSTDLKTNLLTAANATNGNVAPTSASLAGVSASALASNAQAQFRSSSIWDETKIGATYSTTSNPVINTSVLSSGFTAKFYNRKNGIDVSINGVPDIVGYSTATPFPTPPTVPTNRVFAGWTMDLSEDEHIYDKDTNFTSDIYGDVVFYAVWDVDTMTNDSLTASASSVEYLTGKITLTASVSAADMTDGVPTYSWKFGSNTLGDTTNSITKENVNESGTYTMDYCLRSTSEPLWRHRGSHSETIAITPGKLTPQSISVDKDAYYGMSINSLTPTVVMHNSKGTVVNGTAKWYRSIGSILNTPSDPKYRPGEVYVEFYFETDASYNGNYDSGNTVVYNTSASMDIVYFPAKYIQIEYNLFEIPETLSFDFDTYNGSISYTRIASEFDTLWADYYANNTALLDGLGIGGYTPQFKFTDGSFISIPDYRTKPSGYSNVTETISIDVKFVAATYQVTYKFDDDAGTADRVETGKTYGQQILKPSPNPTNGTMMFLGWYYQATDVNGNPLTEPNGDPKLVQWQFDVDCVFGDVELTARWLKAESLDHIEVVANKPSYTALDSIVAGDLTVTAYYVGKDGDNNPVTMPVVLDFADYENNIVYVGNRIGDSVLHVDSSGAPSKVTVSFSYFNNGQTYRDSKTVDLVVEPCKIDVSDLVVNDKYAIYDGNAHSLDPINLATVQHLADPNSRKITGVVFTYYNGRTIIDPNDIIDIGDYSVIIGFTTNDADFEVDPIYKMLYIVSELPPGVEPENPAPSDGDGSFIDKLLASHFPLWQVATMAASALLAIIFLIKTIQYASRAKKAKGEAKKIASRAYASLLPIFSGEVVALNLSNKIWSIMAFAFVGLALLMFVIALITRHSWKKAELAKESAVDEREQRKYEAQNANQLALQEKIVQASAVSGFGGDFSSFEEILRQRDEEHRREMEEFREQQRLELARREEEQAKRDEAMKLMLANMMGRQQGNEDGFAYASIDDTDMLVQRVIAGLLPAMQQMMPETTAYLTAPAYEQSENDIEAIADRVAEKLGANIPQPDDNDEKYDALLDEVKGLKKQLAKEKNADNSLDVDDLAQRVAAQITPAQTSVDVDEIVQKVSAKITPVSQGNVNLDDLAQKVSEKITPVSNTTVVQGASAEEMQAMAEEMAHMRKKIDDMAFMSVDELDDDDFDDEEEWDSILDEDDDDNFVESVIIEADGTVRKSSPNFRMRLKESSEKNREWYAAIKNLFCSQKGVTYRVCKRVEKIRYQGQVIGVIGIAKRSIKLWLALKPYEYDARRYHHKDVSDKPRFVDVPLYVRVGSDRALTRAQELILALFQDFNMEERKRYTYRDIQELIFTLKHNKLLTNKQYKQNLCEVMHVHDCDVLDDETAEKCIETKNVDFIDDSVIEMVKLDDIDANFQDGNRVTLEKLRKLGLVSEDCTGYTVTADKRLTKPLIIVANDFTLTAVKLIVLTGGRAIRLEKI